MPHPTGPSQATAPYLPALPQGVVTEEIVASLDRYPAYEQQAWASSLPPLAMQIFRQMVAKRISDRSPGTKLTDLPSTGRPHGVPNYADRQAPPLPTVKYMDISFASPGQAPEARQAIRLHNMRGVVTHAVVLGAETTEVELTAYIADTTAAPSENAEVSLRVNGNQGSLPTFVYGEEDKQRPAGMRWPINVATSKVETKIEVVATKPGALAETSVIFINRQQ